MNYELWNVISCTVIISKNLSLNPYKKSIKSTKHFNMEIYAKFNIFNYKGYFRFLAKLMITQFLKFWDTL
jgi:hypothetical protein